MFEKLITFSTYETNEPSSVEAFSLNGQAMDIQKKGLLIVPKSFWNKEEETYTDSDVGVNDFHRFYV